VLNLTGFNDIYFEKWDEHITMEKPTVLINNLLFGGQFTDFGGTNKIMNMKTKEYVILELIEKVSEKKNSMIHARAYNADGVLKAQVTGSWLDQVTYKDLTTG
jgi:hypothetical protein